MKCKKHGVKHRKFPAYASCIEHKTMVSKQPSIRLSNHHIGCDLEAYAQTLRFRGYGEAAKQLDEIASRIK